MKTNTCASATLCLLLTLAGPVLAERGDRDKPIHLEADRMSIDDIKKIQTLEGKVVLIQGTIELRTNHLVVTQDADGFQKGTATGGANGLARFRQKRDGRDEYFEGEAERIDYDARSEKAEFFNRAWVRSGLDEVRGQYISYDGINETYLATTGGPTKVAGTASPARVRAIIQPKSKAKAETSPAAQKSEPLVLKPAANVTPRTD